MLLKTTRVDKSLKKDSHELSLDKYVTLYTDPPSEEITLDEFELYALDRLQLLRGIETLKTRGFEGAEYENKLKQLEAKYMPLKPTRCVHMIGYMVWCMRRCELMLVHLLISLLRIISDTYDTAD
jgi:hypothetical protein